MSRLTTAKQRLPTYAQNATPSPILFPPSGPSSGRATPFQRPPSTGSQYSESPFGGGMGSRPNGSGYSQAAYDVETQNDDKLDGLLGKVKILKDITVGIGDEIRDSNLQLGTMNDAFSSTSTFLGGTFRRMTKMAKRQGGTWCYFMGFLLLCMWIFVVVWWLRR